jgi:hypothetical protein
MKTNFFFSSFLMALIFMGCATRNTRQGFNTEPENPLIGAWTLVSSNNTNPEGEYVIFDKTNTRQIKILTPDHFMFITERIENGEKKFASAAGGRYELDGRTYIEYIDYASWEDYVPDGENILIEEVWERVEDDDLDASR